MVDLKKKYADCDRVRLYRQKMGLTQDEFAALMGVASSTVRNWENAAGGSPPGPGMVLIRLADERGVYPNRPGMAVPTGMGTTIATMKSGLPEASLPDSDAILAMSPEELAELARGVFAKDVSRLVSHMRQDARDAVMDAIRREGISRCLDEAMGDLKALQMQHVRYVNVTLHDILLIRAAQSVDGANLMD